MRLLQDILRAVLRTGGGDWPHRTSTTGACSQDGWLWWCAGHESSTISCQISIFPPRYLVALHSLVSLPQSFSAAPHIEPPPVQ